MEKYNELIQNVTKESQRIIGNATKTIFSRASEPVVISLAQNWGEFADEAKSTIAKCIGGNFQMSRCLVLFEELNKQFKQDNSN